MWRDADLVRRSQERRRLHRVPAPSAAVGQTGDVPGLDRREDSRDQIGTLRTRGAGLSHPNRSATAIRERRPEGRMIAAEKRSRQIRASKPPRGLRKAYGRKVQERKSGEQLEVCKRSIKSGNQGRRGVRFLQSLRAVGLEPLFQLGPSPGMFDRIREPRDAEQRQRKPGREERIHEGRGRRQKGPVRAGSGGASEG